MGSGGPLFLLILWRVEAFFALRDLRLSYRLPLSGQPEDLKDLAARPGAITPRDL